MEGSNFCPLKGEPSTSQPFFSMSCTFCGEKRFEHKYASLPLTKVTVPPRGLTEHTLIFSSVSSSQFHYSSVAELSCSPESQVNLRLYWKDSNGKLQNLSALLTRTLRECVEFIGCAGD